MRDGDRIAFAANTTALGRPAGATLWLWHQGRLDSLALAQANIRALDVSADQVVLAVQSAASPLAAGSQSSTGLKHVLTVDEAMNVTQVLGFPTAANPSSWAVASVTGGIGFLAEGELRWLSGTLAPLKPVRPLPNTAMVTSGIGQLPTQVVNGRWWVLAPAGMDYPEGLSGVSLAELEID